MARGWSRSRQARSSTPSRCFLPTVSAWCGHPTGTVRCRARPTSSLRTGSSGRDPTGYDCSTAPQDVQGRGDRLGQSDRCGAADLDRPSILHRGGLPYSLREHGKHTPDRRLPVCKQGDFWWGARDSSHRHSLLPVTRGPDTAAPTTRCLSFGGGFDARSEYRETCDRHTGRHAADGSRYGDSEWPTTRRAVRTAYRADTR